MELLDIVDINGNPTGKVMEKEKVHDLNLLHFEIGVFIINHNNEILLQKRAATKRFNPNKWGLCAGHVDSGEKIELAALREIEEEIGLKVALDELKVLENMEVKVNDNNSHITRYFYVVTTENNFKIQEEELSEVKWYKIDTVINMIKNNDDSLTLKKDRLYLLEKLSEIKI